MARKTWIKLKRGLVIDPKHRYALGIRVWLYLYMLDIADWDSGKIYEWRDKDAADEIQMPLPTVRSQRRQLENDCYISCLQLHQRQEITILNWTNPREYSGEVYNDKSNGDKVNTPSKSDGDNNGDNNGYINGDNNGNQNLSLLHYNHSPQTTDSHTITAANAFDLFQNNISLLTPIIADQLKLDIEEYTEAWVCDAIEIAVKAGVRKLAYIESILKRWHTNGKDSGLENKQPGGKKGADLAEDARQLREDVLSGKFKVRIS